VVDKGKDIAHNTQQAAGRALQNGQNAFNNGKKIAGGAIREIKKVGAKVRACVNKNGVGKCVDKVVTKVKKESSAMLNKACKKAKLPAVCKKTVGKGCKAVVAGTKKVALFGTDLVAQAAGWALNGFMNVMENIFKQLWIDIKVAGDLSSKGVAFGFDFAVGWGGESVSFSLHLDISFGGVGKLVDAIVQKIKGYITAKFPTQPSVGGVAAAAGGGGGGGSRSF
jgi:hypothetical protein